MINSRKLYSLILIFNLLLTGYVFPQATSSKKTKVLQESYGLAQCGSENQIPGQIEVIMKESKPRKKYKKSKRGKRRTRVAKLNVDAESIEYLESKFSSSHLKNIQKTYKKSKKLNLAKIRKFKQLPSYKKGSKLEKERIERMIRYAKLTANNSSTRTFTIDTDLNCKQLKKLVLKLNKDPKVEHASLTYKLEILADKYFDSNGEFWHLDYQEQWNMRKIGADKVWDSFSGDGIRVAVMDTGVDHRHTDLRNNILRETTISQATVVVGRDFVDNDRYPADPHGHGTHVAGIIAAQRNNNIGVVGVANRAKIIPIRICGEDGMCVSNSIVPAIEYAVDHGADVINMSLGYGSSNSFVNETNAIRAAIEAGVVVVVAAGNTSFPVSHWPQRLPEVITVGNSTETDERALSSSHGDLVDIAAPGGASTFNRIKTGDTFTYYYGKSNILSTVSVTNNFLPEALYIIKDNNIGTVRMSESNNPRSYESLIQTLNQPYQVGDDPSYGYFLATGTSMAAPHVAGAAAILKQINPSFSAQEIRDVLVNNAAPISTDRPIGNRLDVASAVNSLKNLARPSNLAPSNNMISQDRRPSFSWGRVVGADYYNLVIDGPDGREVKVVNAVSDINDLDFYRPKYNASSIMPAGSYSWRVEACNAYDCSSVSFDHNLTIRIPPEPLVDSKPQVVGPFRNQKFALGDDVRVIWFAVDHVTGYKVIVQRFDSAQNTFVSHFSGNTASDKRFIDLSNLPLGRFRIQVVPLGTYPPGQGANDFRSDNLFIEVIDVDPSQAPEAPEIISPSKVFTQVSPIIHWVPVAGATHYEVIIGSRLSGSGFTRTFRRQGITSNHYIVDPGDSLVEGITSLPIGTHRLRVYACNDNFCTGAPGSSNRTQIFVLRAEEVNHPPADITGFDVVDIDEDGMVTFEWDDQAGVAFYDMRIDISGDIDPSTGKPRKVYRHSVIFTTTGGAATVVDGKVRYKTLPHLFIGGYADVERFTPLADPINHSYRVRINAINTNPDQANNHNFNGKTPRITFDSEDDLISKYINRDPIPDDPDAVIAVIPDVYELLPDEAEVPSESIIMDDRDSGYSSIGMTPWTSQGYGNDLEYGAAGNGNKKATWRFTGLAAGTYKVAATWQKHSNRASDAPYTIKGVSTTTVDIDQKKSPDDFNDSGASWENLGNHAVGSDGILVVELDNQANGFVIADAIRIEAISTTGGSPPPPSPLPPPPPPTSGPTIIDDKDAGYSSTGMTYHQGQGRGNDLDFGAAGSGSKKATWRFTGLAAGTYKVSATWQKHSNRATNAPYTIAGVSTVTVRVNQEKAPNDFNDGGSSWENLGDSHQVGSDGILVVELSNAANEFVIADAIRIEAISTTGGPPPPPPPPPPPSPSAPSSGPTIIDDKDAGYSSIGMVHWTSQGYGNDLEYGAAGNGNKKATWRFTGLAAGTYKVAATWQKHSNRASDAPYTIKGVSTTTVDIDQKKSPDDFNDSGASWENLGIHAVGSDGILVVELDNQANGFVIADAIRIEPISTTGGSPPPSPPPSPPAPTSGPTIIDDGETGYSSTGMIPWTSQGYGNDLEYGAAGNGNKKATWRFTGLAAGTYKVAATWKEHKNRATDAPYTITGANTSTVRVDQEKRPDDFNDNGASWESLGNHTVASDGILVVKLSNAANEFVIADAIRIEKL